MLTKETIKQVIHDQQASVSKKKLISREKQIPSDTNRILIITGIRRCGKSTFLRQVLQNNHTLSINFEDPRLEGFDLSDFKKIETIAKEENKPLLLFDEVQNIFEWEKYARSANDRGIKLHITGSNASMLSKELGTRLTGRYAQIELFPFSYNEYLLYTKQSKGLKSINNYLIHGGFPEYLFEENPEYLRTLLRDIVMRDIAVRRDIRNEHLLIRLATHIVSNVGKEFSFNNITKTLEIKSVRTTIDYCDFLQESYLIELIPRFSFSIHKQLANPKKAYCIDTGMAKTNSISLSEDIGRLLENAVFLFLRRSFNEIYYYKNTDGQECDFLIKRNDKITMAVQVCLKIDENNINRELNGIKSAMTETQCKDGFIITLDQEDELEGIHLIPAWKWMS